MTNLTLCVHACVHVCMQAYVCVHACIRACVCAYVCIQWNSIREPDVLLAIHQLI